MKTAGSAVAIKYRAAMDEKVSEELYINESLKGPYKPIRGDIWHNLLQKPIKSRIYDGHGWIAGHIELEQRWSGND